MSILVSPEKLRRIHEIIDKYHAALILHEAGELMLTQEEIQMLKDAGLYQPAESIISSSYKYGKLLHDGEVSESSSAIGISTENVQLTDRQVSAKEASELRTATAIRDLAANVKKDLSLVIHREEANVRRSESSETQAKREAKAAIEEQLKEKNESWKANWGKMSLSEKVDASMHGTADAIREDTGEESLVFKQPEPDACSHCVRLYTGNDGHPKVFTLSALAANGDNTGLRKTAWKPVIGITHPNCQCQLMYMPDGWGFDENGSLAPGAQGGEMSKSLLAEGELDVPRIEMPQITNEDREHFLDYVMFSGVDISEEEVLTSSLVKSQQKIHEDKVEFLKNLEWGELLSMPLLVSLDDYLLDGHHRCEAMAQKDPAQRVNIIRIHRPAEEALELMRAYPNVKFKKAKQLHYGVPGTNSPLGNRAVHHGHAVNLEFGAPQPFKQTGLTPYVEEHYKEAVLDDALKDEGRQYIIRVPLDEYTVNSLNENTHPVPVKLSVKEQYEITSEEIENNRETHIRLKERYLEDPYIIENTPKDDEEEDDEDEM